MDSVWGVLMVRSIYLSIYLTKASICSSVCTSPPGASSSPLNYNTFFYPKMRVLLFCFNEFKLIFLIALNFLINIVILKRLIYLSLWKDSCSQRVLIFLEIKSKARGDFKKLLWYSFVEKVSKNCFKAGKRLKVQKLYVTNNLLLIMVRCNREKTWFNRGGGGGDQKK